MLSRQCKTMNFPVSHDNIERQNQKQTRRPSHLRKTRASLFNGDQIKCNKHRWDLLLLLLVWCYLIVNKKQKRNVDDSSALTAWCDKK